MTVGFRVGESDWLSCAQKSPRATRSVQLAYHLEMVYIGVLFALVAIRHDKRQSEAECGDEAGRTPGTDNPRKRPYNARVIK